MNTESQPCAPSTTNEAKSGQDTPDHSTAGLRKLGDARGVGVKPDPGPAQVDISTDHETKALRRQEQVSFLFYRGPFRVYFNRREDAPRVVSIDNGSHAWEINCKSVKLLASDLRSTFSSTAEYPTPAFTLDGWGEVTVDGNGTATIRQA